MNRSGTGASIVVIMAVALFGGVNLMMDYNPPSLDQPSPLERLFPSSSPVATVINDNAIPITDVFMSLQPGEDCFVVWIKDKRGTVVGLKMDAKVALGLSSAVQSSVAIEVTPEQTPIEWNETETDPNLKTEKGN